MRPVLSLLRIEKTTEMKTRIFTQILLMVFLSSLGGLMAQNQGDTKKKETEKTIIIDGKKLSGEELAKEIEKIRIEAEKQAKEMDKEMEFDRQKRIEEAQESLELFKEKAYQPYILRGDRFARTIPSINYYLDEGNVWSLSQNNSLVISKNLEDVTNATNFTYEVKTDNSSIHFSVNGTLSIGEMKITMKMPDGSTFQELTISPLADVNWNQQFNWDEDEQDEYLGKWTISINALKAQGKYNIRINSR